MNSSLRHVVFVLLGCFTLLFAQLNRIQVYEASSLQEHAANTRTILRQFDQIRADIVTSDGVLVATSIETPPDSSFRFQRSYPEGDLYAHTVGFLGFAVGADGMERSHNDVLVGQTDRQQLIELSNLLQPDSGPGTVITTLDHELQAAAKEALGERPGSVVALDPRTGAVKALWSWPTFDPNRLSDPSGTLSSAAYTELLGAAGNPLRARSFRDLSPPGSTFKVITAAAALEAGAVTLTSPVFEATEGYTAPLTTHQIKNFGGRQCGGDLVDILVLSCNGPFAQLAAEFLGPAVMVNQAEAAGFNSIPPIDLPSAVASSYPVDFGEQLSAPTPEAPAGTFEKTPVLAQTAIGQNDVQATPLQMALLIAAVANDGIVPTPHLLSEVRDSSDRLIVRNEPNPWRQAMRPQTAADLSQALITAATEGGARTAAVDGFTVGAKTGTAQQGGSDEGSHAWIVAFGGPPGSPPELVIAVLVEATEGTGDQTGGRVAGPIAQRLFQIFFESAS